MPAVPARFLTITGVAATALLVDCTASYAVLNGVQFTGLATLNPSSPAQITMAVTGASTTSQYAIVSTLTGS